MLHPRMTAPHLGPHLGFRGWGVRPSASLRPKVNHCKDVPPWGEALTPQLCAHVFLRNGEDNTEPAAAPEAAR